VSVAHPLSFEKADRELRFNRIHKRLVMPDSNLHFPEADISSFTASCIPRVRCAVMQGGQGDIERRAFDDPLKRNGKWTHEPPTP
jgi:glucosamine-6-phosphate deaminase